MIIDPNRCYLHIINDNLTKNQTLKLISTLRSYFNIVQQVQRIKNNLINLAILSILLKLKIYFCLACLYIFKMGRFANFARSIDRFSTTRFVGYKGQETYSTICGGVFSILIIAIFIAISMNELLKMGRMEQITSGASIYKEARPAFINMTFTNDNPFMLAFRIYDRSYKPVRQKVIVTARVKKADKTLSQFNFIPCNISRFKYDKQIMDRFEQLGLDQRGLCIPQNKTISMGLEDSSTDKTYLNIQVHSTIALTDANYNILNMVYLNAMINPQTKNYKSLYLDSQTYYKLFSNNYPIVEVDIAESVMKSDRSLMPFSRNQQETIIGIDGPFKNRYQDPARGSNYFQINFSKSTNKYMYTQKFRKIGQVISFIGGLFTSIIPLFFIINFFSSKAFLISASKKLFKYNESQQIESKGFDIIEYFKLSLQKIKEKFCGKGERKQGIYEEAETEMAEQISIELILQQLKYLLAAVTLMLTESQMKALHLIQRQSLADAKAARKYFSVSHQYLYDKHFAKKTQQSQQNDKDTKERNGLAKRMEINDGGIASERYLNKANPEIGMAVRISGVQQRSLPTQHKAKQQKAQGGSEKKGGQTGQALKEEESSQIMVQLKQHLMRVAEDANRGNEISRKLMQRLSNKVLNQIDIQPKNKNQQKQIQRKRRFS